MSAKHNLVCEQAATFTFQFTIKTDDTAWDLTGYTVTLTVRPFVGSNTTTIIASTANGLVTTTPLLGRVNVTIPAGTTADFIPARYAYDLVFDSGTVVTRILDGKFVVVAGVTV